MLVPFGLCAVLEFVYYVEFGLGLVELYCIGCLVCVRWVFIVDC